MSWQPSATLDAIRVRADVYHQIRAFFYERGVLEVETPALGSSTATDPLLKSLQVDLEVSPEQSPVLYLQTSPEFPMKRLLASGSGSIYQICKTFRSGEVGGRHNPEFTMLEWYRAGMDLWALMDEVVALIQRVLDDGRSVESLSYADAFARYLEIDPFCCDLESLNALCVSRCGWSGQALARDDALDLLISTVIEPHLGNNCMTLLHSYPASQASLAQVMTDDKGRLVAQRCELYLDGLEIANAYEELLDESEQRQRFLADNEKRDEIGSFDIPLDERLLQAMASGLPDCSGVALGLDRLLMIKLGAKDISEVIAFPFHIS